MFTKPLSFLLVVILSAFNLLFLLLPLVLILLPFATMWLDVFLGHFVEIFMGLVYLTTSLMLLYLLFDYLFGFTVRAYIKRTMPIEKASALYCHSETMEAFTWLKKKFGMPRVRLYIDPNMEVVNAYAVGSMRKKAVVITMGLLHRIHQSSHNQSHYINAVRGILGHELSHLSHADYLPGLLVMINQKATNIIARVLGGVIYIIARIVSKVPVVGYLVGYVLMLVYRFLMWVMNLFMRIMFKPIYHFIHRWLSRSVEFRCDRESAYAFGGSKMAMGLSMLGKGSYFSIFSTHPRTKTRVKKVERVVARPGRMAPGLMTRLSNASALLLLVYIWYQSGQLAQIESLIASVQSINAHSFASTASDSFEGGSDIFDTIKEKLKDSLRRFDF